MSDRRDRKKARMVIGANIATPVNNAPHVGSGVPYPEVRTLLDFYVKAGLTRVRLDTILRVLKAHGEKWNKIEDVHVYATMHPQSDVIGVTQRYNNQLQKLNIQIPQNIGTPDGMQKMIEEVAAKKKSVFALEVVGEFDKSDSLTQYQNAGCFALLQFKADTQHISEAKALWGQTCERENKEESEYTFVDYLVDKWNVEKNHWTICRYPFKNSIASLDNGILEIMLRASI